MSGIQVFILRRDLTLVKKRIHSGESHAHYGRGAYLNMEEGILATVDLNSPVLIFQEGNAVPRSIVPTPEPPITQEQPEQVQHPFEGIKWQTWYIPMLRGLNREHHSRLSFNIGKFVNVKTFPFWIIGFALAAHFLGIG